MAVVVCRGGTGGMRSRRRAPIPTTPDYIVVVAFKLFGKGLRAYNLIIIITAAGWTLATGRSAGFNYLSQASELIRDRQPARVRCLARRPRRVGHRSNLRANYTHEALVVSYTKCVLSAA